jgi:Holliday junction resolvase
VPNYEDLFRDRVVRPNLEARGAVAVLVPKTRYGRSGVSDLLACYCGHFIAIECKSPQGGSYGLTPTQSDFLESVRKADGYTVVARTWEEVERVLDEILKSEY